MARILIAECKQEISSFNPWPSTYDDYTVQFGQDVVEHHRGGRREAGGAIQAFDEAGGHELIGVYSARARSSGGTLEAAGWQRIAEQCLNAISEAPPADAFYFSMHGAMGAEDEDDPEGYLLQEARRILGEEIPIVLSLDLHGILTDRMIRHVNGMTSYHTYPHVDSYQTGQRAGLLLLKILAGARPTIARVIIPALVRGDELITATGLFGRSIRACQAIEHTEGGLAAGMHIGNPFTDVPELRSLSYVITDNDPERAQREAIRLAEEFWVNRERMQVPLTSMAEAARMAQEHAGPTMLVDAADATSSGASGDSNAILRALVESGYRKTALIPIVDASAVQACFAAGVGNEVETTVGGERDPEKFPPLRVKATVRVLSDGHGHGERGGRLDTGPAAAVDVGGIRVVLVTKSVGFNNRAPFWAVGQDPRNFDATVMKSPHWNKFMYEDWCKQYINVDTPGATSANVRALGHAKCWRPIFPLDEGVELDPRADLFVRPSS